MQLARLFSIAGTRIVMIELLCQTLLDPPSFPESTVSGYNIRRFCSDDAAGVVRLVEDVYGDNLLSARPLYA